MKYLIISTLLISTILLTGCSVTVKRQVPEACLSIKSEVDKLLTKAVAPLPETVTQKDINKYLITMSQLNLVFNQFNYCLLGGR